MKLTVDSLQTTSTPRLWASLRAKMAFPLARSPSKLGERTRQLQTPRGYLAMMVWIHFSEKNRRRERTRHRLSPRKKIKSARLPASHNPLQPHLDTLWMITRHGLGRMKSTRRRSTEQPPLLKPKETQMSDRPAITKQEMLSRVG